MDSKESEVTIEQKQLAEFVKSTHLNLRKESAIYGANEAWQRHIAKADILETYAVSMKKLATQHWAPAVKSRAKVYCRIEWVKSQIWNYYFNDGQVKYDMREEDIKNKIQLSEILSTEVKIAEPKIENKLIRVLDVGSCYDPFRDEADFEVTAIDIAPSCPTVLQCDFLTVNIGKTLLIDNNKLTQLPLCYYDAVVFSLFLEYLPCPTQRYTCCAKAYEVLKPGGLLLIVTPDSKHINANSKFMKSWRYVLSKLGFMRVHYEKQPHIHCIVYRKCIHPEVAHRWTTLQTITSRDSELFTCKDKIYIPQDFQDHPRNADTRDEETAFDNSEFNAMALDELPFNSEEEIL